MNKNITPRNNKEERDGYWEVYMDDNLIWRGNYINDKRNGLWKWYDGNKIYLIEYIIQ